MRIAIDGRELFHPYGMGRLLHLTLQGLRQLYPETDIAIFLQRDKAKLPQLFGSLQEDEKLHFYSCPISLSSLIWENYFLKPNLTAANFDLFYLPHNRTGISSLEIPMVALICDVIPLLFPHFYTEVEETIAGIRNAAALSRKVITISRCSRHDLQKHLDLAAAKIEVVYPSIGNFYQANKDPQFNQQVLTKFGINKPYFLNVGGFDPRKNLNFLLRTFARYLKNTNDQAQLVVTGPLKALHIFHHSENPLHLTQVLGIKQAVIFTDVVADEELRSLYQEAAALVFPSLYEGFGLPPAESAACGTPVIAAAGSSIEEAVDGHALFFPPLDEATLLEHLKKIRQHDADIKEMATVAQEWVSELTWEKWTREIYRIFKEATC